jgi:hypothetical protein
MVAEAMEGDLDKVPHTLKEKNETSLLGNLGTE